MEQLRALDSYESLPYIDREYEHPTVREAVTRLIEQEMGGFRPDAEAYLRDYPYPKLSERVLSVIKAQEEKAAGGKPQAGGVDLSRYSMQAPATTFSASSSSESGSEGFPFEKSCGEWKQAVRKGESLVEYQENRLQHLELQVKHISPLWLSHIAGIEKGGGTIESQLLETNKAIDAINFERKAEQEKVGRELALLARKRDVAIEGTAALRQAIANKRQKTG